jgi:thiamine pyrophosphokinase
MHLVRGWCDMDYTLIFSIQFPNAIVGDLDSLRDDVRDFFKDAGRTEIVHVPEQDSTDFTKALRWLRTESASRSSDRMDVVALGGLGGRVDQGFSIIHHLLKAVNDRELLHGDIYLLSEQSLSFVLENGRSVIHGLAPGPNKIFQENVGIIPMRGPAEITTTGLEWDVKDWKTELGGQISTSNHTKADAVEIDASDQVLFTIELADTLCAQRDRKMK